MLLGHEGFDHYGSTNDALKKMGLMRWGFFQGCSIVSNGRSGAGKALRFAPNGALATQAQASYGSNTTVYMGCGITGQFAGTSRLTFNLQESGSTQMGVTFDCTTGIVSAFRGSTTLATSGTAVLTAAAYPFIEIGAKIDNTTGWVEARVEGNTVFRVTNVDTQTTANNWTDSVLFSYFGSPFFSPMNIDIDDFYVANDVASGGALPVTNFLGDCGTVTFFPYTAGRQTDWTPVTPSATTNWQNVDNPVFQGDSAYNQSSTSGQADLFPSSGLSGTVNAIVAVTTIVAARNAGVGTRQIATVLHNGTVYDGATQNLSSSYAFYEDIWYNDPTTGTSWLSSGFNGYQFGYKLIS